MPDPIDPTRRHPVWLALSDLWLDTELQEDDLQWIAEEMDASGYSIEELHEIYLYEVAPVVYGNLLVAAGEWGMFDPERLVAEVEKRCRARSARSDFWARIRRPIMTYATERHWRRLVAMIRARREMEKR